MKKRLLLVLIAAVMLCGCRKQEEELPAQGAATEETGQAATQAPALDDFVDTQSRDGELSDHVTDKVDGGDISQSQALAGKAKEVLKDYYQVMFNFDGDTEDYSDILAGYYEDDLTWNARSEKNVHRVFSKMGLESRFVEYKAGESAIFENADGKFIKISGFVKADMEGEGLEEGTYCNACENMFRIEEDGSLSFVQTHMIAAYREAGFSMHFYKDSEVVEFTGDSVLQWNFYNPGK